MKKLPKWAWAVAIIGGLAVGYLLLRKSSSAAASSDQSQSPPATDSGGGASAGGGGIGGASPLLSTLDSSLSPTATLRPLPPTQSFGLSVDSSNTDATGVPAAAPAAAAFGPSAAALAAGPLPPIDAGTVALTGAAEPITNYLPGTVGGYTGESVGGVLLGHGAVTDVVAAQPATFNLAPPQSQIATPAAGPVGSAQRSALGHGAVTAD